MRSKGVWKKLFVQPHPLEHSALSSPVVRLTGYTWQTGAFFRKPSDSSQKRFYSFHAQIELPRSSTPPLPTPPLAPSWSNPCPHVLQNFALPSPVSRLSGCTWWIDAFPPNQCCNILSPSKTFFFLVSAHRLTSIALLTLIATLQF